FAIDEIPQLINVVTGDMSLVGPRPLAVEPQEFDDRAVGRHNLRPGMTGAWQVEGANALTYEDMIRLDLDYVSSWSLLLDFSILARTVMAVLVRRGAY
ncbi:MAG: sugar transferase, partial [Acidimicrobiales bacterium]